jgi:hypothetical protein
MPEPANRFDQQLGSKVFAVGTGSIRLVQNRDRTEQGYRYWFAKRVRLRGGR